MCLSTVSIMLNLVGVAISYVEGTFIFLGRSQILEVAFVGAECTPDTN
jgi:hypothetical protein